jgi:hypothetical protein
MKTILKWMFPAALLLPTIALAGPPTPVQGPTQAPGKQVQAPTQAPVQAPSKTAMAAPGGSYQSTANTGYRTYSYQPSPASMVPMNYGPGGYAGWNNSARKSPTTTGFDVAGRKITNPW